MSKEVDERVVEMRFDNSHFERNVATSMSTLDKFKQKLNFSGASKGLDEIGAAAKNVDMNGLGAGVETISAKFSALQVIGVTALANITNSAVDAGKRLVSALSIDQVTAGWSKYEQKTASVQTIVNATGKSIDEVNGYLDKLMWYSDETSYGFTDMTSSLGQLTSAGGDIEKLIPMIEGIANATAFAGKGASEFSRAIYNLNQSYSAGYLQYMDWKSLDLAGVSSKQLKQVFIDTAKALGKLDEEGKTASGTLVEISNFGQTLQDKWADTEVMEAAFGKFSELTEAAYKAVQSGEYDTASEAIAALADQYDEISVKAFTSAQEAKSFTEAIEATKDAVSSGWMKTSELIFGNYDEAKQLWTDMANSLWEIFAGGSESRNAVLGDAMNSKWDTLIAKIEETGVSAEDFQSKLKETAKEHGIAIDDLIDEYGSLAKVISAGKLSKSVIVETIKKLADNVKTVGEATSVTTEKLEHFQGIVNKVIRGDFGNGAERMEKLAEAGENYATVQGLVNKIWERNGKTWSDTTLKAEDLTEVINELSESELESLGYTEEQAKALKELAEEAEKTGTPINELIEDLNKPSGRELVFSSIHNAFEALIKVVSTFRTAWSEIFTSDRMSAGIYKFVEGLNSFTEKLIMSDDTADKLRRTIKGVVALIDVLQTVFGGSLRLAFKLLSRILGTFDLDILDVTASIGDAIVKFRDWFDSIVDFEGLFEKIVPYLVKFTDKIKELFASLKQSKVVNKVVASFKKFWNILKKFSKLDISMISFENIVDTIRNKVTSLPSEMKEIGRNIIDGLQNGIGDKLHDLVVRAKEIGTKILETVKAVLGIHSPSTEMFEIGENIIAGLVNGIASGIQFVIDGVAKVATAIIDFFKNLDFSPIGDSFTAGFAKLKKSLASFDWKKLLAIIPIGVVLVVVKEMYDFVKAISEGIGSINDVIDGLAGIEKSFSKVLDAKAFQTAAEGLEKVAKSIAILAAAVIVLSFIDPTNLYRSVGIIVVLSIVLTSLAKAMAKMQSATAKIGKDGLKLTGVKTGLLTLSAAILLLAATVKLIGGMDTEQAIQGFVGLIALITAMVGFFAAYGLLVKGKAAQNMDKAGAMLLKMSVALLILVGVAKLLSGVTWPDLGKAGVFVTGFTVFVAGLVYATKFAGSKISKVGSMLIKVSIAIGLMVGVCKLVNLLSPEEMVKGAAFAGAFLVFVGALVAVTKIGTTMQIAKVSGLLLSISISLMLMVGVCKLVNLLSLEEVAKGALFLAGFMAFVWLLVKITTIGGEQKIAKIAATLLAMSVAVGIMAGVAILLSLLDPTALSNGVVAVVMLGLVMAAMIAAAKGAEKCVGNLIAMAIAVGVMAGAVAVLSTIDANQLAAATLAMTIVMGMFAIILKMTSQTSPVTLTLLAMSVAIAVLGGVLYLLSSMPAESSIGAAVALSAAMLAFAVAMRIISGMQGVSGMALVSIAVMTLVVAALGGILYLLQGLDPVQGIAIVGVIATFVAVLLIALAAMQLIQAPSIVGLAALAIVTLLVAALAGVLYLLQGVNPTQAIQMVGVITVFLLAMEVVCLAASAVGALAGLAIPGLAIIVVFIGALGLVIYALAELAMDVIAGMPKMGSDLSAFMTNLQPFLDGIQSIPDNIVDKVTDLSKAIGKLGTRELLESIKGIFTTDGNSLADLGNELKTFGDGMATFAASMVNVDAAINSLSKIKDLQEAIPEVDLTPLEGIGKSLQSYSASVALLNVMAIGTSISMAQRLSALAVDLASMDFSGVNNFNILPIGMKLAAYSANVSSINAGAVTNSVTSASQLRDFIASLVGLDISGVSGFSSAVDQLARVSIAGVVDGFKSGSTQLYQAGSDMIDAVIKGMRVSIGKIALTVKGIIQAASDAFISHETRFIEIGGLLAVAVASGLTSKKGHLKEAGTSLAASAAIGLYGVYDDFYSVGGSLAEGFANGISANSFKAKAAAVAMAQAALDAAKEILRVNSPSKETAEIGGYFGQGFVNAIVGYAKVAYDSSADLASSAKQGLSDAVSMITSVIENDIDTQPVIRPVIDFSDIESGASKITTLLDGTPLIRLNANTASISSAVDSRRQNGTNSDVVSAIDKLYKKFDDLSQPSYNINGITYDSGSEVSEAIQTLIRAAKIERRV